MKTGIVERARQTRAPRRALLVTLVVPAVLFAACGGGGHHVAAPSLASSPPHAAPTAVSAAKSFLSGPGHELLAMNTMAPTVSQATPAATCRSQASALVGLISQSGSTTGPADQQLSELLSDEESTLAQVLTDCARGVRSKTAPAELATIHTAVDSRLRTDGIHS